MERPSHIIFDTHPVWHRLPFIGLALSLQIAMFSLFVYGLASNRIADFIRDIEIVPIKQKETAERPKPLEPTLVKPKKIMVEKPIVIIDRGGGDKTIHAGETEKQVTGSNPPVVPDHGAVSIASTHTVPPYPPIARRIGMEGKVTLRLTVSAEGKVTGAEVVSSSGRDDMDQTAQQWIMAHWAYKPALDNGVPVVSHVLATVNFNLINAR